MHSVRNRPLTRLFLTATVCLDVVIGLVELRYLRMPGHMLVGLAVGQLWLVSGWLALGSAHRLLRGAVFVSAVIALTTALTWSTQSSWNLNIVGFSLIAGAAAPTTAGAASLLRRVTNTELSRPTSPVRFSIAELLGWTVVVAIGSWAIAAGEWRFTLRISPLFFQLAGCISAGLAMVAWVTGAIRRPAMSGAMATAVALSFYIATAALDAFPNDDSPKIYAWGFVYLVLFAFVQWFDLRTASVWQAPAPGESLSGCTRA
jgi:hypothetical protein